MPPSKILQGRCVKPGASFPGRTKFFLVGFSLAFPRFPRISKSRLNTGLEKSNLKDLNYANKLVQARIDCVNIN